MASNLADEVLSSFYSEALGYIPAMRVCAESLALPDSRPGALSELHRLAHNVRGASSVVGIDDVAELAQGLEDLMLQIQDGAVPLDEELRAIILEGIGQIDLGLTQFAQPAPPPSTPAEGVDPDLLAGFLIEADEHLQSIAPRLAQLQLNRTDKHSLKEVRRSVHTIKGAAAMIGLPVLCKLAHRAEDLLDSIHEDAIDFTGPAHFLLVNTCDLIAEIVAAQGATADFQDRIDTLYEAFDQLLASAASRESTPPQPPLESPDASLPAIESEHLVRVPLHQLDQLMRLAGELFIQHSFCRRQLASSIDELGELRLSQERLSRVTKALEVEQVNWLPGVQSPAAIPARQPEDRADFDALEFDRYSQLHLTTRDLVETGNDLNTAGAQLGTILGRFKDHFSQQERLTREIQEKILRMRMVPLSSIAARLERVVRVTAAHTGKKTELLLSGLDTELDRKTLDEIIASLEHLLRNAVDHGIELPPARLAAGKPESGCISISARVEGADVVICLADDGAGLNTDRLRAEAERLGYAATPESLVFEHGFSTASEVTEISGRGVGLDVVKSAIESLKGSLTMDSVPGRGVSFTLRIPSTLAITKVLLVEVQQQTIAIPLSSIIQVSRGPVAEHLHILDLPFQLGLRDRLPNGVRVPLVVVRAGARQSTIAVDRIIEAREVAVQPPSGVLRNWNLAAGTTILGDGSVIVVLNPGWLHSAGAAAAPAAPSAPPKRRLLNVLIVDDSLSVRRVMDNLISSAGWKPVQAKDGVEALEVLDHSDFRPDAIVMDVEMPRMDGFELAERLRSRADFRRTPLIMVTSRAGDKHRNRAFQAGVNLYLTKPYQDDVLLDSIRRLTESAG